MGSDFLNLIATLGASFFLVAGLQRWTEIDTEAEMAEYLTKKDQ